MARICLNEDVVLNGRLSITRTLLEDNKTVVITGVLATHYYIEEIKTLETYRYKLEGVEVYSESFGSDDFDIIYNFKAKELINRFGSSNLSEKEIMKYEEEIYKKSGYLKESILYDEEDIREGDSNE